MYHQFMIPYIEAPCTFFFKMHLRISNNNNFKHVENQYAGRSLEKVCMELQCMILYNEAPCRTIFKIHLHISKTV